MSRVLGRGRPARASRSNRSRPGGGAWRTGRTRLRTAFTPRGGVVCAGAGEPSLRCSVEAIRDCKDTCGPRRYPLGAVGLGKPDRRRPRGAHEDDPVVVERDLGNLPTRCQPGPAMTATWGVAPPGGESRAVGKRLPHDLGHVAELHLEPPALRRLTREIGGEPDVRQRPPAGGGHGSSLGPPSPARQGEAVVFGPSAAGARLLRARPHAAAHVSS